MMRGLFVWAIAIFSAAIAYVIIGILLFQPERPPPINFETVESLLERSQEAYQAQTPPEAQRVALSPAEEAKKAALVAAVQRVITQYEATAITLPPQAAPALQIITEYTRSGLLPPSYPMADGTYLPYTFAGIPLASLADSGGIDMGCEGVGTAGLPANLLIGNDQDNRLSCTKPGKATLPRMLLGGPGNDTLRNLSGPALYVPGTGDDTIESGDGATLILLEDGWGRDTAILNCASAGSPANGDQPLNFPFRHFILFSPNIARDDVVWNEDKTELRHLRTGDSLQTGGACVNLVFYDRVPTSPAPDTPTPPP